MTTSKMAGQKPVEEVFRREKVAAIARTKPATALPGTPLGEAIRILKGDSGGCVVVVEADNSAAGGAPAWKCVGIFTERDYLDNVPLGDGLDGGGSGGGSRPGDGAGHPKQSWGTSLPGAGSQEKSGARLGNGAVLRDIMTPKPRTLFVEESLDAAIQLMTRGGYRHLPLVDGDGHLVGVLSARDIIFFLAEFFPTEVMNLPPRFHQEISSRDGG